MSSYNFLNIMHVINFIFHTIFLYVLKKCNGASSLMLKISTNKKSLRFIIKKACYNKKSDASMCP